MRAMGMLAIYTTPPKEKRSTPSLWSKDLRRLGLSAMGVIFGLMHDSEGYTLCGLG